MTNATMKAAMYLGPEKIEMRVIEVPEIGPKDLLVQIKAATTCGTDVKTYRRGHPYFPPPIVFGHELAGVVTKVGDEVSTFTEGMRVVAANSAPCNKCFFCKRGKQNLCENLKENMIYGAFAEYIRIPGHIVEQNTHQIPNHVPFQAASLVEPLACVVNGNDAANIQPGDSVAIVGVGPIGLMHLQLAKLNGANQIIAIDLNPKRLDIARELGATDLINPSETNDVEEVKKITSGRGAEVVIEAAGSPVTWENAIKMTRPAGTTILFSGLKPGTTITVDSRQLHYEDLTIKGIFHHTPFYVEKAFDFIVSGQLKTDPLITHEMPLENLDKALQTMIDGNALKVVILP